MVYRLLIAAFIFLCPAVAFAATPALSCLNRPVTLPPRFQSFRQTIVSLQQATGCSVMAEVADPLPADPEMRDHYATGAQSLDDLVRHCPGYQWEVYNGVVFIYNVRLRRSRWNIGSVRLRLFDMPTTLSDLKLALPNYVSSEVTGLGGFLNGIGIGPSGDAKLTSTNIYRNVSVRDVLSEALKQAQGISILELSSDRPTKQQMLNHGFERWIITAGEDMKHFRISEPVDRRRFVDKKR